MNNRNLYKKAMDIAAKSSMKQLDPIDVIDADRNREKKKVMTFKRPSVVIIAACVLVLGSFTAYAAITGLWSNNIKGMLSNDETKAQELEDADYLTSLSAVAEAVTCNDITVTPLDMIFDGTFGYLTLKVEGLQVEDGIQPMADSLVYIGDDWENSTVGGAGNFYPGYTVKLTEDGKSANTAYDNGDAFEYTDENNQNVQSRYYDGNGAMEYIICFGEYTGADVIGETLHVEISDFSISTGKAETEEIVSGNWNFEIPLKGNAEKRIVNMDQKIDGTNYILTSVEITPLSIKTNFKFDGEADESRDADLIPYLIGARLGDDSFQAFAGSGEYGFENEERTIAYTISSYGFAVVDPEDIVSLKFNKNPNPETGELIWVDLSES